MAPSKRGLQASTAGKSGSISASRVMASSLRSDWPTEPAHSQQLARRCGAKAKIPALLRAGTRLCKSFGDLRPAANIATQRTALPAAHNTAAAPSAAHPSATARPAPHSDTCPQRLYARPARRRPVWTARPSRRHPSTTSRPRCRPRSRPRRRRRGWRTAAAAARWLTTSTATTTRTAGAARRSASRARPRRRSRAGSASPRGTPSAPPRSSTSRRRRAPAAAAALGSQGRAPTCAAS